MDRPLRRAMSRIAFRDCGTPLREEGGLLASVVQPLDAEKAQEFGVRGRFVWAQPNGNELAKIAALIDSGNLKVVLHRILPLSEARRAHELSQNGHTRGKIVLRVKNSA